LAPKEVISLNDPTDPRQAEIFRWLEKVVHIIDIPFVSRPPGYSSQEVNHLKDPNVSKATKMAMVRAIAEASEAAWEAICAKDSAKLGKALSDTMKAWAAALPYTTDPYLGKDAAKSAQLREFVAKYDAPNTKGCLFSGAGGGFLMVINDAPIEGAMKMTINNEPVCLPYKSNTLEEAKAHSNLGPPPASPPWGVVTPWQFGVDGLPFNEPKPYAKLKLAAAVAAALAVGLVVGKKL